LRNIKKQAKNHPVARTPNRVILQVRKAPAKNQVTAHPAAAIKKAQAAAKANLRTVAQAIARVQKKGAIVTNRHRAIIMVTMLRSISV